METMLNFVESEVKYGFQCLTDALTGDRHMLREGTQQNGVSFLFSLGRSLVYNSQRPLPDLEPRLVVEALRHAGNNVLGRDDHRKLDQWRSDMTSKYGRDEAEDLACGLIDEMLAHRYVGQAAQAYLDALDEDDQWREPLERELETFRTIAKVYEDGVKSHPNGIRALTWAYRSTNFVKNQRAMLPEGAEVPWYLDPTWYENYGMVKT